MLKELELREKMRARAMELGSILTPEAIEAMGKRSQEHKMGQE